jgi:hypothetical protein
MYIRVVRFTDTHSQKVEELLGRISESDGPPPGVPSSGIQVLVDESQGTVVVLQEYETADDMRKGHEVFDAMDAADTPGTRASVDMCEVKLERHAQPETARSAG